MDVKFDLGVSGSDLLTTLTEVRKEFVVIRDETTATRKEAEKAFQGMAQGGEAAAAELTTFTKKTREQTQSLDALTKKLNELEKNKAFDTAEIKAYEKEIVDLKKQIAGLNDELKKGGAGEGIKNTRAEFQLLMGVIDAANEELKNLDSNSGAFKQLSQEVAAAELAASGFNQEVDESNDKMESAKKVLKEYTVTLQNLALAGHENTQVYKDLKREAGDLKDTIADVNEEIAASGSDTKGLDNVIRTVDLATNAYGVYEGVVALTGEKNEDFEKTLIKLNAVMAISNSLQQITAELKRKDNVITTAQIALQQAYTFVVEESILATKGMQAALVSTGFGAALVAIGLLVGAIITWTDATEAQERAQANLNRELENQDELLDLNMDSIRRQTNETVAALETAGAAESDINKARIQSLERQKKLREQDLFEKQVAADKSVNMDKETFAKTQTALKNAEKALKDIDSDIKVARLNNQKTLNDELLKRNEEARKKREKADADADKALEDRLKRIADLTKKLQEARIAGMEEGRDKQIAAEVQTSFAIISELERQLKAEGITEKEKKLINANIEQEKKNHTARLLAIDIDFYKRAHDALEESQKQTSDILATAQESEKNSINKRYDDIIKGIGEAQKNVQDALKLNQQIGTTAANDEQTTALLAQIEALNKQVVALQEKRNKELGNVDTKFAIESLNKKEEIALAQADLLKQTGLDEEQLTQLIEDRKLEIIIKAAEDRILILKAAGEKENELAILQQEKIIADAQKKLNRPAAKKPITIWSLLGIDDKTVTPEEKQAIVDGFKEILNQVTQAWNESIQARIDQSQRLIDQLSEQIDAQQAVVDHEKELAEEGRANSLDVEEKRLADLEAQKAREQETLKKAQEEQAKLAAAQVAINGIVAASNLALAAATFFKTGSEIGGPIAGTIMALAAIATMITTFIAVRNQARAAAQQSANFDYGGGIDLTRQGSSHNLGGIPFYDGASGKKLGEARRGEYGYFFKDGRKAKAFEPLFDLINGSLGLPELKRIGITAPIEQTAQNINQNEPGDVLSIPLLVEQNATLRQIARNTEITTSYHNGYRVETSKNRTRKINS